MPNIQLLSGGTTCGHFSILHFHISCRPDFNESNNSMVLSGLSSAFQTAICASEGFTITVDAPTKMMGKAYIMHHRYGQYSFAWYRSMFVLPPFHAAHAYLSPSYRQLQNLFCMLKFALSSMLAEMSLKYNPVTVRRP
jgi:hypothetical protein